MPSLFILVLRNKHSEQEHDQRFKQGRAFVFKAFIFNPEISLIFYLLKIHRWQTENIGT